MANKAKKSKWNDGTSEVNEMVQDYPDESDIQKRMIDGLANMKVSMDAKVVSMAHKQALDQLDKDHKDYWVAMNTRIVKGIHGKSLKDIGQFTQRDITIVRRRRAVKKDIEETLEAERRRVIQSLPDPVFSDHLQKMVKDMRASIPPHEDVYPPAPIPGQKVIPTGGLAKCICSPGCTKELNQPAYIIADASRFGF